MADETLSYLFELDAKMQALDGVLGRLDKTVDALGLADKLVTKYEAKLKDLDGANAKVEQSTKKGTDALKKHEEGFKGIGETVEHVKGKFHEFFSFVGAEFAFEGLKKAGELVLDLGRDILQAAGGAERMALSFDLMVGQDGARGVLEWIDRIASKTEFTDDQLKGWALDLFNAGVKMKDVDTFLAAGLDIAARSKDGLSGMSEAIHALAKVNLTGRIEARSLIPLNIGPDQLRTLQQFKGMSNDAIRKAMETGTVTKDQLLQIIAGPDKLVGDLGLKAGTTLGAALKNAKNLPDQFFQMLADTPAFDKLKMKLEDLFEALNPDSPNGQKIFDALENAFTGIVDLISKIDFDRWSNVLVDDVLPAIVKAIELIEPTLEAIERVLRGLGVMAGGVAKAAEIVVGPTAFSADAKDRSLETFKKEMGEADIFHAFFRLSQTLTDLTVGLFTKSEEAGASIPAGMTKGIQDGVPALKAAAADMAFSSIDQTSSALDSHSPSRVFEKLGASTGQGFVLGVEKVRPDVNESLGFAAPSAGGGSIGGVSLSMGDVVIHVSVAGGGAPEQQGKAAGEAAVDAIQSGLLRALERLASQQGS